MGEAVPARRRDRACRRSAQEVALSEEPGAGAGALEEAAARGGGRCVAVVSVSVKHQVRGSAEDGPAAVVHGEPKVLLLPHFPRAGGGAPPRGPPGFQDSGTEGFCRVGRLGGEHVPGGGDGIPRRDRDVCEQVWQRTGARER